MKLVALKSNTINDQTEIVRSDIGSLLSGILPELLGFLILDNYDTVFLTWDLDATISSVIRLLSTSKCKELAETHKTQDSGFDMFYVEGKVFTMCRCNEAGKLYGEMTKIYNLSQYFPDESEPQSIQEILKYAERLIEANHKMKLYGTKLTSPVSLFEQQVLNHCDLPNIYNTEIPDELTEWAWRVSGRLLVQSYQLGHWDKVFDYDITSAFGTVLRNLIDIRDCDFVKSDRYEPKAVYGYCDGVVEIKDGVLVHPIIHDSLIEGSRKMDTPVGKFPTKITKHDWDFIKHWQIGDFKLNKAWWVIPKRIKYPLRPLIDRLFGYKALPDKIISNLAKRQINGIYGLMSQELDGKFGKHANPIWFEHCADLVRLEVCRKIYKHKAWNNLLHIGVDGAIFDKEFPEIVTESNMFNWRLSYSGEAVIMSSDMVWYSDKLPKSLTIEEVKEMINKHPNLSYYDKNTKQRISLKTALEAGNLKALGTYQDVASVLDFYKLNPDRIYDELPYTGKDLLNKTYKSKPMKVVEI